MSSLLSVTSSVGVTPLKLSGAQELVLDEPLVETRPIYNSPSKIYFAKESTSIASALAKATRSRINQILRNPVSFEDVEEVIIGFPGIGSPGWLLEPVMEHLNRNQYAAVTWGQQTNFGPTVFMYDYIDDLINRAYEQTGNKITGVGHSLGALFHLHFARLYPEKYDHVIGLAGPCDLTLQEAHTKTNIGPAFTVLSKLSFLLKQDLMNNWQRQSDMDPIDPSRSMIIAANDGIVDPLSCMLPNQRKCRNFIFKDVDHAGLVVDKDVHSLVVLLKRHGNGPELDGHLTPDIVSRLITPDQVHAFVKSQNPSAGDVVRGATNIVSNTINYPVKKVKNAVRSASNTVIQSINAPITRIRAGSIRSETPFEQSAISARSNSGDMLRVRFAPLG